MLMEGLEGLMAWQRREFAWMFSVVGGAKVIVPLLIRSCTLCLRLKQSMISCLSHPCVRHTGGLGCTFEWACSGYHLEMVDLWGGYRVKDKPEVQGRSR